MGVVGCTFLLCVKQNAVINYISSRSQLES
jgi:hypothetical protein